jgi:DNA-binding response OmpR family regulator
MTDAARVRPLVLLVEDDRDSREMYAMGLDMFGLRVMAAATGAEALSHASRERPDVIVTDLTLPDMDGLALCGSLGREPGTAGVPVLALTGRSSDDDRERAAAAGVRLMIVKPCPPDELAEAIRSMLPP